MQIERENDEYMPAMPAVRLPHILEYLFEVGPVMPGAMGPVPITHQEIAAWQRLRCIYLSPWEVSFLRRLSLEYLGELHEAENPLRPAPWADAEPIVEPQSVAERMRQSLGSKAK